MSSASSSGTRAATPHENTNGHGADAAKAAPAAPTASSGAAAAAATSAKKAKGKKSVDSNDAKLISQRISQLELDQAGEKDLEAELGRLP